MSPATKADVIVTIAGDLAPALRCLEAVLEQGGSVLRRLIVIDDRGPGLAKSAVPGRLARERLGVQLLVNSHQLGYVGSYNRGLAQCEGDAVLLDAACRVSGDWLSELAAVAHSEERTACAVPLFSQGATGGSVAERNGAIRVEALDPAQIRAACGGLPRWTVAPELTGSCIYLRGNVLDAVGWLDSSFASDRAAIHDWVARAQALGFVAKRANHVYIHRVPPPSVTHAEAAAHDPGPDRADPSRLERPGGQFDRTLDGRLADHAITLQATGKLRVAVDIRHLPREQVGTRICAVSLAQALAGLPEIELTLLVRDQAQASGMRGRVVTAEEWSDDVAVIHKPAQVFDPRELKLLFESSAHLVITYQDLIAYRIPQVFPADAECDRYRTTSRLTLPAVQRIIAYSESVAGEITAEFDIPRQEIMVVPPGVEAEWFAHREEKDPAVMNDLGVPARYFLSLATDFPHKNLTNLLDAYALLRRDWRDGEPPSLVLAGHRSPARAGFYAGLESKPLSEGVIFLGPVSRDQLRILYQHAVALVFPSLYEGFGLPPLEAMAAGTPVIALRFSSVPEVGGDCVLYPDGLSINDLARAMARVASDEDLRNELKVRGLGRIERFHWEETARATCEVYRSAVRNPSSRALQMRRHWRDGILRWAENVPPGVVSSDSLQPLGIKSAWQALNLALYRRLTRELARLQPLGGRKSA
jgi:alpha-1,3-rhamnosyl/mannosyltransferase